jgi:hypothetical protein
MQNNFHPVYSFQFLHLLHEANDGKCFEGLWGGVNELRIEISAWDRARHHFSISDSHLKRAAMLCVLEK